MAAKRKVAAKRQVATKRPRRPDNELDKAAKSGYREGYQKGREISKPKRPAKPTPPKTPQSIFDAPVNKFLNMSNEELDRFTRAYEKGVKDAKGKNIKVQKPKKSLPEMKKEMQKRVERRSRYGSPASPVRTRTDGNLFGYYGRGGSAERLRGK